MPHELINFIIKYGYLSIFLLVFIQELGVPTFPNEITLIYFGYTVYQGILKLPYVISLAISADVTGSCFVYFLFYYFSFFIKKHKPKWLPVPHNAINYLKNKIQNLGKKSILIGRLTPYVRGYTSVVCGLLKIAPSDYVSAVLLSAVIWSCGYVSIGCFAGPYWNQFSSYLGVFDDALIIIPLLLLIYFIIKFFLKRKILKH